MSRNEAGNRKGFSKKDDLDTAKSGVYDANPPEASMKLATSVDMKADRPVEIIGREKMHTSSSEQSRLLRETEPLGVQIGSHFNTRVTICHVCRLKYSVNC